MNLHNVMDEYFVEEKSGYDKFLDFLVFLAVFAVTIFLILDIMASSGRTGINWQKLESVYFYSDIVIFIIFSADLVRLWYESNGVKDFVENYWLDIIATIPFGLIAKAPTFSVLKLTKYSKLSKLTKLGRVEKISRISKINKEFKAASHLKQESEEYKKKHRL